MNGRTMAPDDAGEFASSPCMMHEFADESAVTHILYLRIEESADGFRWQACVHDQPEPLEVSAKAFRLQSEALHMGRVALDRLCDHFRRYNALK